MIDVELLSKARSPEKGVGGGSLASLRCKRGRGEAGFGTQSRMCVLNNPLFLRPTHEEEIQKAVISPPTLMSIPLR